MEKVVYKIFQKDIKINSEDYFKEKTEINDYNRNEMLSSKKVILFCKDIYLPFLDNLFRKKSVDSTYIIIPKNT
ncbi:hypothetical protein J7L48_01790, partial [bacterium]|nr:hypothetical protein [bacterium]